MVAKIDGPFSWEDDDEGYEKYTKTQTVKELQLVEEHMTKIHLQDAMMRLPHRDDLATEERKAQVKETMRQAGWMPIPKPLTDEKIKECSYDADGFMISREQAMRAVERAHGIGVEE